MEEIYLTDMISVKQLQTLQNSFSKLTGLAALTTDINGNPVTEDEKGNLSLMVPEKDMPSGAEIC